jgi:hypothetical protein
LRYSAIKREGRGKEERGGGKSYLERNLRFEERERKREGGVGCFLIFLRWTERERRGFDSLAISCLFWRRRR